MVATRNRGEDRLPVLKLNRRNIAALQSVEQEERYYDTDLPGFGLRVFPSGARSWFVEYRPGVGGRRVAKRRLSIGSAATFSPEEARDQARKMLAEARLGNDPAEPRRLARTDLTVDEFCDRYMKEGTRLKKDSTLRSDRSRIDRHIRPLLGKKRLREITAADVERFINAVADGETRRDVKLAKKQARSIVRGGRGAATRTVRLLGGMFTWATRQGLVPSNPVHGVPKFPDKSGERYLTSDELARLGAAITAAETEGVPFRPSESKHAPKEGSVKLEASAAAAIRLLIFTGCRVSEILRLRWAEVDLERGLLFLPDSKTGRKTVVLSRAAQDVLEAVDRAGGYVIAGDDPEKPRADLKRPWALVCRVAGLEGVRLHDLRHSFASVGAGAGMGLPLIGKLLGHANASTTARYAHLDASPMRRAANEIGDRIAAAMIGSAHGQA